MSYLFPQKGNKRGSVIVLHCMILQQKNMNYERPFVKKHRRFQEIIFMELERSNENGVSRSIFERTQFNLTFSRKLL